MKKEENMPEQSQEIRSFTRKMLEEWVVAHGEAAFRGRQLFRWLWRPDFRAMNQATDLSKRFREWIEKVAILYVPQELCIEESVDGTMKWAFQMRDGLVVETVLIPGKEHSTICISSQVGCAMGCTFCHTSVMGFVRQLAPSEIAGQVLVVMSMVRPEMRPRNIVFMGMGEPLTNYDNVMKGIDILTDDLGLNFSNRRITLSTCGIVDGIKRLARDRMDIGLAISLHAPFDDLRSYIMPINRRYPLQELMETCRNFKMKARRRITFEYLLLKDVNDAPSHAAELARILHGIPCKINIIRFNESAGILYNRPSEESVNKFREILCAKGYTAIVRKSMGQDISAACGQLYADVKGNMVP